MCVLKWAAYLVFLLLTMVNCGHLKDIQVVAPEKIQTGAQNTEAYLPLLEGKRVGVVANHASLIGEIHLVDSLLSLDIEITKIYSPEHGFLGKASAGEKVGNQKAHLNKLHIISLYGDHKKPTKEDLSGIDILVFDLQDVGVRFFTYISTLTYVMEACAENDIPLIVLDRPNPNGFYIDGPVLEPEFKSYVGLHPVPIVYGMTIGEYAKMVNGEGWLENKRTCSLSVVNMNKYTHRMIVDLPVKPSPNLPNWQSVYLYPSLCFFEGTIMSAGRGTDIPFQIFGHPEFGIGDFSFTPEQNEGALNPKYENQLCYGTNLIGLAENYQNNPPSLNLSFLISSYQYMKAKEVPFFVRYFKNLAGTEQLQIQIEEGLSEEEIRHSWQEGLDSFKKIRAKYLLYD